MNTVASKEEDQAPRTGIRSTEEAQIVFLKEHFPKLPTEEMVKYCKVGETNWRINFWGEKRKSNPKAFMKNLIIVRSCYVILTRAGETYTYEKF